MNDKSIKDKIHDLASIYTEILKEKIEARMAEMNLDDKSHYLIYRVLGVSSQEGDAIDLYQNRGRFLYRYAGALLQNVTVLCFKEQFPDATPLKIPNTITDRPKKFEIDCLVGNHAYEIKWRDATTDGDHILKEHTRIKAVANAGYIPVRLMYYYPNRDQAVRIQSALEDLYKANGGLYFYGDTAWEHILQTTGVDLLAILEKIADEREM